MEKKTLTNGVRNGIIQSVGLITLVGTVLMAIVWATIVAYQSVLERIRRVDNGLTARIKEVSDTQEKMRESLQHLRKNVIKSENKNN